MNFEGFEQIADYAWLKKGRKYWSLWAGNPFCISNYKPSLEIPKEQVIKEVKQGQAEAKQRFAEQFPDVEWECVGQQILLCIILI